MAGYSVSVVIPTYNSSMFILDAVESVYKQNYPVEEIIVVDDGSTDNTCRLLESHRNRIKYVYQDNAGPGAARNRGVALASGDWIAFLDSDDRWEPNHIEKLIEASKRNTNAVMVYCGKRFVDAEGKMLDHIPLQKKFPSGWIFKDLFYANYISSTSVVMIRRATFLGVGGFDEKFRFIAEDYDLWIRVAAVAPIIGVPEYTVLYRRHENNLTLQTVKQIEAHLEVLRRAQQIIRRRDLDMRNKPDLIDIRTSMKNFYDGAIVGLFYLGEYDKVLTMGFGAIMRGYITKDIIVRWLLCLLPSRVTTALRDVRRVLARTNIA